MTAVAQQRNEPCVSIGNGSLLIDRTVDDYRPNKYLTRQAFHRGMAVIAFNGPGFFGRYPFGRVSLPAIRKALDTLTIEDETASVKVRIFESEYTQHGHPYDSSIFDGDSLTLTLTSDGRVKFTAPCGQSRKYKVTTLDRILTRLGF
jgi:hypothetical protein